MQNFDAIQKLVGSDIKPDDLKAVDCFIFENFALFIQSVDFCKIAVKHNHTYPSYMIIIQFDADDDSSERTVEVPQNYYLGSILSPGVPHEDKAEKFPNYYTIMIDRNFFEEQFKLYQKEMPLFKGDQFIICHDVLKILHLFAFESTKNMPNSAITLGCQTMLLTHWIIRSILDENYDMRSPAANARIARIQAYIEQHLGENLTVSKLAENANMSVSSFCKLFRKECGLSPKNYLSQVRLTKSQFMLRRDDYSITEIAYKCGFSSNSHLTAAFHKEFGISPKEYRERFLKQID